MIVLVRPVLSREEIAELLRRNLSDIADVEDSILSLLHELPGGADEEEPS